MTESPTAERPRAEALPTFERGAYSLYLRVDMMDEIDWYVGKRIRAGDTRLRRSHVVEDAVLAYLDRVVNSQTETS